MRARVVEFLHRVSGANRVLTKLAHLEERLQERLDALEIASSSMHIAELVKKHGYVTVRTAKPVAHDSPDHVVPWGTARDNSSNLRFNARLRSWIPAEHIRLLDLGCSGGGQVRTFLDQMCYAVGIEGSDYSKKILRAEWAAIPEFLFTADITEPFSIVREEAPHELFSFSIVTLWEVIEHIRRDKLGAVFDNIDRHLASRGVVIMSVSPVSDIVDGVELHQTIESREWWLETVSGLGFEHHERIEGFFGDDYVRGEENARGSFHLILTRKAEEPMYLERLSGVHSAR